MDASPIIWFKFNKAHFRKKGGIISSKLIAIRIKYRVIVIILFLCTSCINILNKKHNSGNYEKNENDLFLVRIVSVKEDNKKNFAEYLRIICLPVWSKLIKEDLLDEINVFQLEVIDSMQVEYPTKDFLILAQFTRGTSLEKYLEAEKVFGENHLDEETIFKVIRSEVLVSTPNSYFQSTHPQTNAAKDIDFFIEFIDVNNSVDDLTQYRNLMMSYFGPVNGILVEKRYLYNFMAFETVEIIMKIDDSSTNWNQIHISGDFKRNINLNWDSLYSHFFQEELSTDMDSVWALLPKIRELLPYYTGRLMSHLSLLNSNNNQE